MILNCCSKSGVYCTTYNRSDLYGRIWEISHGINCSSDQFKKLNISLMAQLPAQLPVVIEVATQSIEPLFSCECVGAGFCSYFKTELNKRAWELSHGVNYEKDKQIQVVSMIDNKLNHLPIARAKVIVMVNEKLQITLKTKSCGCKK